MLTTSRIPLWLKFAYSAFVAVLVPFYWHSYGPTNFLYFCDVALLITFVGLWIESPLLFSMAAVGIALPQTIWMIDFAGGMFGGHVTGVTEYMFNPSITLFVRGLSFFHFWLPILVVWLVWRVGYDRRALIAWTLLAETLLLICYFLMPSPPPPADNPNLPVNINYVYGFSDQKAQTWMPPLVWLGLTMIALPLACFWPTHYLLSRLCPIALQKR